MHAMAAPPIHAKTAKRGIKSLQKRGRHDRWIATAFPHGRPPPVYDASRRALDATPTMIEQRLCHRALAVVDTATPQRPCSHAGNRADERVVRW